MITFNMTQHEASAAQLKAGVVELAEIYKTTLLEALNFEGVPTSDDVAYSAQLIAGLMDEHDPDLTGQVQFMMGGAPYLMAALTQYAPVYRMVFACSNRVSEEKHMPDGSVRKVNVFKHIGFTPMYCPNI
jgi:hypothetical protein